MKNPDVETLTGLWRSNRNPHLFLSGTQALLDYAFQPIADIHTGEVYGFEALLRNVEQAGFGTIAEIFDFAASIGCLAKFDLALRRKAIGKFAALGQRGEAKLFFNVDGRVLDTPGFLINETASLLAQHDLAPPQFCMELLETYNNASLEQIDGFVALARRQGFPFAMDDFGRGYSQLTFLYKYEPNIIKIDRFFISSIQSDARKRLFVAHIVDLAHILGMRVVAEGVETEAELHACREIGCDLVQGFLVARPFLASNEGRSHYGHIATIKEHRPQKQSDADLVKREIVPLTTVRDDASMDDVMDLLGAARKHAVVPVVDAKGEPLGIICEGDLKSYLYMPFGRDLLRNPTIDNRLRGFVRRCPIADIHSRLDRLIDAMVDETAEGVIITSNGRYYGFLTTSALLKISNQIRLRQAEDQNPLTKLPGNASVTAYASEEATNSGADRFLCYVDFDNFKPFNDTYGFRTGDRAIMMFAELLRRELQTPETFVGHVGGDDFFIGMKNRQLSEVARTVCSLREHFALGAESFYEPQHREQGFILAQDRSGETRRFSLLSCSVAVLHLPRGIAVENQDVLGRHIAALKNQAKNASTGVAIASLSQCEVAAFGEPEPQNASPLEKRGGEPILEHARTLRAAVN